MELLEVMCPACGECFEVVAPPPGELPADVDYDCEICCRPMRIVFLEGDDGETEAQVSGLED